VLLVAIAPVKTAPDSSALSVFKLLKLASTSLLVKGVPFPERVTIVAIYVSPKNRYKKAVN
jgi:hypothetical protein